MIILHIANISEDYFNGVCVVVPQHVQAQSEWAETALLNITGQEIPGVRNVNCPKGQFSIDKLSAPFNHPDLVVFHECYRIQYIGIARNLRKKSIPYVIIPHGELQTIAQNRKHLKKSVANFLIFNDFVEHSAGLQCLSEREKQETHFKANKFVGTNGVALKENIKSDFHKDSFKLVYIGRLDAHQKGLDLLIEAAGRQIEFLKDNNCTIDIYGPDYCGRYDFVKKLIEDNNAGKIVSLHHEISGQEKEKVLLEADAFIQTSRFEGMPLGIIEALSYALPCAVTGGTTLGEAVSEAGAGWSCETDVSGVEQMLMLAVQEKDRLKIKSENALRLAEEYFSWHNISEKTVKYYQELVRQGRR